MKSETQYCFWIDAKMVYEELTIPSAKLAALTRKINELKLLIGIVPPVEVSTVRQQFNIFGEKLDNLEVACQLESETGQVESQTSQVNSGTCQVKSTTFQV